MKSRILGLATAILITLLLAGIAGSPFTAQGTVAGTPSPTLWKPTADAPIHWQWQIGEPLDISRDLIPNVTVYDIDGLDNNASVVEALHARGYIVIAYLEFGDWTSDRPDSSRFPESVKGNSIEGWPGEKWLDIRSTVVRQMMAARLDMVKAKGFDAVEPDCIDGYTNNTGFPLTAQDQLDYNRWIAEQCHQRGLSVGLKDDIGQAVALQPYFDWILNEECYQYSECDGLQAFTAANKAVFQVEYSDTGQCSAMQSLHFNSMTRDLGLVAPGSSGYKRVPCIPDTQNWWWTSDTQVSTPTLTLAPTAAPIQAQVSPLAYSSDADVNNDGVCNILDLVQIGLHLGERGMPGWIRAEVNMDGTVNVLDLMTIGLHLNGSTRVTLEPPPLTIYNVATSYASFTNSWGRSSVKLYYPAISSGSSQPPNRSGAPYPSVVFTGGLMGFNWLYTWVGNLLASHGYIVAVVQVPNIFGSHAQQWADSIKDGISYLQMLNSGSSILAGMMSGVFGAAGHSMGAAGTLLAASQDSRISAVVSMATPSPNMTSTMIGMPPPSQTFGPVYEAAKLIMVPVQIIGGSSDTLAPPSASEYYYLVLGGPKEFVEIAGATHLDYIDIFSRIAMLNMVEKYTRNWFDYYLKGETSDYTYIFGTGAQNDLATGALSALDFELH